MQLIRCPALEVPSSNPQSITKSAMISLPKLRPGFPINHREVRASETALTALIRSRIYERTISLKFLGIILRVLRLEVSVNRVYITNQLQTFARGGGVGWGGVKPICRGDCE